MGILLWAFAAQARPWLEAPGTRIPALAVLVLLGLVSYFGIGQAIGAFRIADLRGAVARQAR
jgi:putative peptidoglycan lipid II flippase